MATAPMQKPGKSRQDYETPDEFLDAVRKFLGIENFSFDLAADDGNYVAKPFFTIEDNALIQDWKLAAGGGWAWLNPPFGKLSPWVEKARIEGQRGAKIAMLVPAGVGSNWWRDHVHNHARILLLNGRISFDGEAPYPKDCALLLYGPGGLPGYDIWSWNRA